MAELDPIWEIFKNCNLSLQERPYQDERFSDAAILRSADPTLCTRPKLQIAYDRCLLSDAPCHSDHYSKTWTAYLEAGGDRGMVDHGIDLGNWKRLRQLHPRTLFFC